MLASEMVAAVKLEGSFDTSGSNQSDATLLSWINQLYRRLAIQSGYVKAVVELGPTVAGQAVYALPATVAEVTALRVGATREWTRTNAEGMWDLQAGTAAVVGADGAFAPSFDADGAQGVTIHPTPATSGLAVSALAVLIPALLTTSPDTTPVVPEDFHQDIVSAAISFGHARIDGRNDLAVPAEQRFAAAVQLLKRRSKTRVGRGPVQLRVAGVHF